MITYPPDPMVVSDDGGDIIGAKKVSMSPMSDSSDPNLLWYYSARQLAVTDGTKDKIHVNDSINENITKYDDNG